MRRLRGLTEQLAMDKVHILFINSSIFDSLPLGLLFPLLENPKSLLHPTHLFISALRTNVTLLWEVYPGHLLPQGVPRVYCITDRPYGVNVDLGSFFSIRLGDT